MAKYERISILRPNDPMAMQLDGIFERKRNRAEAACIALSGRYDWKFPPTVPRGVIVSSMIITPGDAVVGHRGDKHLVMNTSPGARWRYVIYRDVKEEPLYKKPIEGPSALYK